MLKRIPKSQILQLGFSSDRFLTGGVYDWVSREGAAESLEPMKFFIHLEDDSLDETMPADIRELAEILRTDSVGMTQQGVQTLASQLVPDDVLLIEVLTDDSGDAEWVVVQRKAPTTPDLVSWRFKESTEENEAYRMSSLVSVATDDDLRGASAEYDRFLTDHYLQLPASLPNRVRDSDSHGWVQVYFPGYGWIDFEPTPNWPTHDRSPIAPRFLGGVTDPIEDDPEALLGEMESDPFIEGLFEEAEGGGTTAGMLAEEYGDYAVWTLIAVASLFALWLLGHLAWNFGLGSLGPEAKLYAKLTRLGWLGGIGRRANQTPMEYAAHVGHLVPSVQSGASLIAWAYAAVRYGSADEDEERQAAVMEAWRSIRFSLARRIFGRFTASAQAQTE